MSKTLVIHNCTVEITMPDVELVQMQFGTHPAKIRLRAREYVEGALVRHGGKTIKIGRLLLESIVGTMQPVLSEGQVVFFTLPEKADTPAVVEEPR